MGRKALWTVVGLAVVALAVTVARADFRRGHGWCGNGWHHWGPLAHVARELKLGDAQVSQVRSISIEERPTVTALLKDMTSGALQIARLHHCPERGAAPIRRQAAATLAGQDGPRRRAARQTKPVTRRTKFTE